MNNNKLHFNLSQEIYHDGKISHKDEISNFYHYEIKNDDDKEIVYICTEVTDGINAKSHEEHLEIDKFTLKINKDENSIGILRHGIVKSDMLFSINEKSDFLHESVLGKIDFTLHTNNININDDYIEIIYDLFNKNELLSKNIVKITF